MKKIIESLSALKKNIPVNCTVSNLTKLQSRFLEYQHIVSSIPDGYISIKRKCESNFYFIKSKTDLLSDKTISWKLTRHHFKEASQFIQAEIDAIVSRIENNS